MTHLENILIDYRLFEKYEIDFFKKDMLVPIYEDEIYFKVAICENSKTENLEKYFENKLIDYIEVSKNDILFCFTNIEKKIYLFKLTLTTSNDLDMDNSTKIFLSKILHFSIKNRTSDIHIEKYKKQVLFKFRIDGKLKTFFVCKKNFMKPISSYIKLISNLDITQNRIPLDGRFSFKIDNKNFDFRVSTMPTIEAESIVIRILDNKNINKDLHTLGLSDDLLKKLKDALKLNQGLILISGPTGSGKTTTLYSILKEIHSYEKKIITVEDPVEYKIDSINQISVNTKIGLSFEIVLKNILRQDPDIIFIGEIRDTFSLHIALQASLTGHLVLASIHANSAVETISRMIDLKADPFLLSTCLKLIMAQRLVLNHCKECLGKGCQKCNYTKFYDRSCIAEILRLDENISSMIFNKHSLNDIKNYLSSINFKTVLEDGKEKVKQNITSLEEVYKVALN